MNGNGLGDKEYVEEKVAYKLDPTRPNKFLPRISVSKTVDRVGRARVEKSFRQFEVDDIARVLDFEQVSDAPPDGPIMHCELSEDGSVMDFPNRHFCLRGGFLFYFDLSEVSGTGQSHYITYHGPPLGVIPLDKITIEFPPGGRRVFREHAHTNARSGYELVVLHNPDVGGETRPPAFLVAASLGEREKWAHALRARADIEGSTSLRAAAYTGESYVAKPMLSPQGDDEARSVGMPVAPSTSKQEKGKSKSRSSRKSSLANGKSDENGGDGDDGVIQEALQEFGKSNYSEKSWIDQYFETHTDVDAPGRCRTMEQWQDAIKKGLKNAVLEQYEYFVEASGEMTTMGREVIALKNLVETQVEVIKEMKEIDFGGALYDKVADDGSEADELFEPGKIRKGRRRKADFEDDNSDVSSVSSTGEYDNSKDRANGAGVGVRIKYRDPSSNDGVIEIPAWFEDVTEEISAFVKECRYTDATELWGKVKQEVNDIMTLHEQPTDNHLTRKQFHQLQSLRKSLDELAEMTSHRLVEALRRKNEALKQAFKRERADPMAQMAPSVSPCCLGDDVISLRLLVKLGKTQEAAAAYSARRSLLLLESLHERPISGTGSVDLVIYAAQLSQAFFSCLAYSVEGFLDLFTAPTLHNGNREDQSMDESSIHSLMNMRSLPPGALASVVLWCDAELSKFGAAFGGTRILGNLALSPPPREAVVKKGPRVLGQGNEEANGNKDRTAAIEVAAQCVGQAFQHAAENLDEVGLPLTPRLAECIRLRLKGCEGEVAEKLEEQWRHITVDWELNMDDEDIPMDELRM